MTPGDRPARQLGPARRIRRGAALALASLALALLGLATGRGDARADTADGPVPVASHAPLSQWPLPAPAASATPWAPGTSGRSLVDDFEAAPWPRPDRWVQVLDLTGPTAGDYVWAPRACHPAGGSQALWAVGGGQEGGRLDCGASHPASAAASALLLLDLSAHRQVARLGLLLDIWPDAAQNEGLFVNYVVFDGDGSAIERRTVYSATGRGRTWARGIRLDLTDLRDRHDPLWRLDLRGRMAYLEFLFISLPGQPTGEGIHLDNLYIDSEAGIPITPTPGGAQTVGCVTGEPCGTLTVRAFVDGRCDGRFQPGLDTALRGTRVDVAAGAVKLGTSTSKSGHAHFRVPLTEPIDVAVAVPDGYSACANSSAHVQVTAADFQPFGRKTIEVRVSRRR